MAQSADYIQWQYRNPGMNARFIYLYDKQGPMVRQAEHSVPENINGFLVVTTSNRTDSRAVWVSDWEGRAGEDMIVLIDFLTSRFDPIFVYFLKRMLPIRVSKAITGMGFKETTDEQFLYWILSKALSGDDDYALEENRCLDNAAHWEHRAVNLIVL